MNYNYRHFSPQLIKESATMQFISPGGKFPSATVWGMNGQEVHVESLWKQGPLVLEFGSITCPVFANKIPPMNRLVEKYQASSVRFAILYTREAHPARKFSEHRHFDQKLNYARDLVALDQPKAQVFVDTLTGEYHEQLGAFPNSVYVIGTDGIVAYRGEWNDPKQIDQSLQLLLESGGTAQSSQSVHQIGNFSKPTPTMLFDLLRVFWRTGFRAFIDFVRTLPAFGRMRASHPERVEAKEPFVA